MPHTLSSGLGMTKDLALNHPSDLDQLQYKPDRTGCGMTTITGHCGNLAQNNYDHFAGFKLMDVISNHNLDLPRHGCVLSLYVVCINIVLFERETGNKNLCCILASRT